MTSPRIDSRVVLAAALVTLLTACIVGAFATGNRDLGNTLAVGVLGCVTTIVGFYFGSSRSSATKDETIKALAKDQTP